MRTRERQRAWLAAVLVGLVPVLSARGVEAALPEISEIEASMQTLKTAIENDHALGGENLEKLKTSDGECEGRYSLTPGYKTVGQDAWNRFKDLNSSMDQLLTLVQPISDIEETLREKRSELDSLKTQIDGNTEAAKAVRQTLASARAAAANEMTALVAKKVDEQRMLTMIQQGQPEAIRDWLLRVYANGEGGSKITRIDSGRDAILVVDVLFGTFVSFFPTSVGPNKEFEIRITFSPATFLERLFKTDIEVGPAQEYSKPPAPELNLKPATSQDKTGVREFRMGKRQPATAREEINWTWAGKVDEKFQGDEFAILMEAALTGKAAEASGQRVVVARLPVKIERVHEQPWHERIGNWFGEQIAGILLGLFLGWTYRVRWKALSLLRTALLGTHDPR